MTNFRPPLPPEVAACRGLAPDRRAALVTAAKAAAMRFTWAVKARNAAEVHKITEGMGRDEFAALAVVLAEGIKPGDLRLSLVVRAADDDAANSAA